MLDGIITYLLEMDPRWKAVWSLLFPFLPAVIPLKPKIEGKLQKSETYRRVRGAWRMLIRGTTGTSKDAAPRDTVAIEIEPGRLCDGCRLTGVDQNVLQLQRDILSEPRILKMVAKKHAAVAEPRKMLEALDGLKLRLSDGRGITLRVEPDAPPKAKGSSEAEVDRETATPPTDVAETTDEPVRHVEVKQGPNGNGHHAKPAPTAAAPIPAQPPGRGKPARKEGKPADLSALPMSDADRYAPPDFATPTSDDESYRDHDDKEA